MLSKCQVAGWAVRTLETEVPGSHVQVASTAVVLGCLHVLVSVPSQVEFGAVPHRESPLLLPHGQVAVLWLRENLDPIAPVH